MKVTLNKSQLGHITQLIKMKGVVYYDVNLEMTDHIASEVEDEMESSGLEYMKAIKKVFLRYGRFHFMNIEEEKIKKLQKQSWKQFWKSFLQFFTIPKIIITTVIFIFFSFTSLHMRFGILSVIPLIVGAVVSLLLLREKYNCLGKEEYVQLQVLTHFMFFTLMFSCQIIFRLNYSDLTIFRKTSLFIDSYQLYITAGVLTIMTLMLFIAYDLSVKELNRLKNQYA